MKVLNALVGALLGGGNNGGVRPRNNVGRVVGFNLVQSNTGKVVFANLVNGTTYYHDESTPAFSIVAVTSTGALPIHGVQFDYDGRGNYRTDRIAPYSMCRQKLTGCPTLAQGTHSVTGRVINNPVSFSVQFEIVRGKAPAAPNVPTTNNSTTPNRQAPSSPATKQPVVAVVPVASPKSLSPTRSPVTAPIAAIKTKAPVAVKTKAPIVVKTKAPILAPRMAPKAAAPVVSAPKLAPTSLIVAPRTAPIVAPRTVPVTVPMAVPVVVIAPKPSPAVVTGAPAKVPTAPIVVPVTVAPATKPLTLAPARVATAAPQTVVVPTTSPLLVPVAAPAPVVLLNCGGEAYTDTLGRTWSADSFFTGGAISKVNRSIVGTDDDALYTSERYGRSVYNIPLAVGTYTVVLHFAELYYGKVGKRIFDVAVESQQVNDIDLVQWNNNVPYKAITKVLTPVSVVDGFLTVRLLDNVPKVDNPKLSAIEVIRATSAITAAPIAAATKAPIVAPMALPVVTAAPAVVPATTLAPAAVPVTITNAPAIVPVATVAPVVIPVATVAPVIVPVATGAPVLVPVATLAPVKIPVATIAPVKIPVPTVAPVAVQVPTVAPVKPPAMAFQPILINCGGGAFTDKQGRVWMADKYNEGGQLYATGNNILGTEDDELYQTHRWGQLGYKIPVPMGQYEIVLHSAEIYFQEPGKRVFDVNVEGQLIEDVDMVKIAGAAFKAALVKATVYVIDGFITIRLLDNVPLLDYPTLGAIEVNRLGEVPPAMAPAPVAPTPFQTILIAAGGKEYTDTQGRVWMADKFFDGGNTHTNANNPIMGTSDDTVYHSERWGSFKYEIPVPEGNYVVFLHFAEIHFEKRGERVFDVKIEGKEIADIDLIKYGGGIPNKALTREMPVTIDDGFLSLEFIKNEPMASEPKLSGIEVKLIGVHYCHAVIGGPYSAVDADANGYEMVAVDASQSHTHAPGHTLKSFTWKLGKEVVGTGEKPILKMPVGKHDISLTVVDTSGDVHSDFTTITVKPDGYPDISSLVPVSGDVAGGNQVTIKGAALTTATEVKFGLVTLAGSDIKIVDAQTIVVTAPISTIGVPVAVTVVTPFGLSNSRQYTYIDANPIAFNINKLTTFANPTAVNFGPDGKLYVANTKGQLGRFVLNDSYDTVVSSVIATIGDGTRGIHCIAFDPMETAELGDNLSVYISTSFIFHKQPNNSAGLGVNGKIQTVKGANLDIVTNIITGLPVSELDHSVNGIYFGDNGELYIGVGSNTNGGLPGALSASLIMTENYFSAAVLVAHLGVPGFNGFITYDGQNNANPVGGFGPAGVEVFGAGIRNSFGVWKHSNGNVYATDNGPNPTFGAMATGCAPGEQVPDAYEFDELNIVKRGHYYGHPNFLRAEKDPRQCVWRGASTFSDGEDGYTAPMVKLASSTNGIIEFESDHFNGQLRGDLILSKYKDGLFRVILSDDGETVNPISDPVIAVDGDDGLAVTQAPDGSMIDARYEANACFTFQPDEPASTKMDIKTVFPRRGALAGGSKLMIFGDNFGGAPTVTVGGKPCTGAVRVSAKKIECTLPTGRLGRADVVVTIGAASDTYEKGYRYITGRPL